MDFLCIELIDYVCNFLTFSDMYHLSLSNKIIFEMIQSVPYYSYCRKAFTDTRRKNKHRYGSLRRKKIYHSNMKCSIDRLMQNISYFQRFYNGSSHKYHLLNKPEYIFEYACTRGNLEVAKWLYESNSKMKINMSTAKQILANGHVHVVEWLIEIFPQFIFYIVNNKVLYTSCNHLEMVIWLHELFIKKNISINSKFLFQSACKNGNIEIVKWLVRTFSEIDIHARDEYVFRHACADGCLEVAKWLVDTYPNINICAHNRYAFIHACGNGKFQVAKWLIETFPDSVNDEDRRYFLYMSCQYGQL